MAPNRPDDDSRDDLPPTEAARDRRRDHDAAAAGRSGMRTGLAKQFKQVLDTQAKRARLATRRNGPSSEQELDEELAVEPPQRKRGHHDRGRVPPHDASPRP